MTQTPLNWVLDGSPTQGLLTLSLRKVPVSGEFDPLEPQRRSGAYFRYKLLRVLACSSWQRMSTGKIYNGPT